MNKTSHFKIFLKSGFAKLLEKWHELAWSWLFLCESAGALVCLLNFRRQKKRSGLECGEVTFPILGCHCSLKWIVLFYDKIAYYPLPILNCTSPVLGGITRHAMGQIRVKALHFLSNNATSTLLCSVFSFIAPEAETLSRCDLRELLQGHSQVEVLWLACCHPTVSRGVGPDFSFPERGFSIFCRERSLGVYRVLWHHLDNFLMCVLEVESGQMVPVPRTAQEGKFVPWGRDSREDKQGLHSWGEAVTNHNKVLVLYPCMAFFVVVVRWMKKVKKEITSLMISFTSQSFKLTRPK